MPLQVFSSYYRRYKLIFESFLDMNYPKEAKNDPFRQEPATITDTGIWVLNQSLNTCDKFYSQTLTL